MALLTTAVRDENGDNNDHDDDYGGGWIMIVVVTIAGLTMITDVTIKLIAYTVKMIVMCYLRAWEADTTFSFLLNSTTKSSKYGIMSKRY